MCDNSCQHSVCLLYAVLESEPGEELGGPVSTGCPDHRPSLYHSALSVLRVPHPHLALRILRRTGTAKLLSGSWLSWFTQSFHLRIFHKPWLSF